MVAMGTGRLALVVPFDTAMVNLWPDGQASGAFWRQYFPLFNSKVP